jgi:hypothetical protein
VLKYLKDFKDVQDGYKQKVILKHLLSFDQLQEELLGNKLLQPFAEAEIRFPPTYKMEALRPEYKVKKGRTPSW